jgi:hypothetical protein
MRPQENQSLSSRNSEAAQQRRNRKKHLRHQCEELMEENKRLKQQIKLIQLIRRMASKVHEGIINSPGQGDGERQLQVLGGGSHGEQDITRVNDEKDEVDEQGLWEMDTESAADEESRPMRHIVSQTVEGAVKAALIREYVSLTSIEDGKMY